MCVSNMTIAEQNIDRLKVSGASKFNKTTRLTMLPIENARFR